jgi:hypothetical protein
MPKISKKLATELAQRIKPGRSWDILRDLVDLESGGELDAWQLDTLTDWVAELHEINQEPTG